MEEIKKHEKLYFMEAEEYKSPVGVTLLLLAFSMVYTQEVDANPSVQVFSFPITPLLH